MRFRARAQVRVQEREQPRELRVEQLGVLEGNARRVPDRPLRCLPHDELEALVTAKEHARRVPVRPRVADEPVELQEHAEPALVRRAAHLRRDPRVVQREVHALTGSVRDALPQPIVAARGRVEVDGQIRDGCVRRRYGAGHDPEQPDVGGEISVGLLDQIEGEVELTRASSRRRRDDAGSRDVVLACRLLFEQRVEAALM